MVERSPAPGAPQGAAPSTIDWLFRNRETGRITIAQWPNPSIGVFIAATLARRLLDPAGTIGTALTVVGTGALLWWALDEVIRGVNPWRRILGTVVLVGTGAGLLLDR
jgi:hypothetical protein